MGKQVNFYMLEPDELEFAAFVCARPGVSMITYLSDTSSPVLVPSLPVGTEGEEWVQKWGLGLFFWQSGQPLAMRQFTPRFGKSAGQTLHGVDSHRSHVIEFGRSGLLNSGGRLRRGRIWAEMWYYDGDQPVYKGKDFEDWYDSVSKWIRKRYAKVGQIRPYNYIGPAAERWHREGGVLGP